MHSFCLLLLSQHHPPPRVLCCAACYAQPAMACEVQPGGAGARGILVRASYPFNAAGAAGEGCAVVYARWTGPYRSSAM